jgi:CRISPR-associated protein Cas5t
MRAVRVTISAWTASFRYGGFMIGVQPTLPVPPLSTVFGLMSAATGRIVTPHDTFVAYTFRSHGRGTDLERILEVEPGAGGKWNVIKREQLLFPELVLYVDTSFEQAFRSPHYQLLLGRSTDLACVDSIDTVDLEIVNETRESRFGHGIYTNPPTGYSLATMYALPVYFTDTIPRRAIGTRPFMMVTEEYTGMGAGVVDSERELTMQLFTTESLGLSDTIASSS